jgi:7,8-dihydro-6-hydroxymethylpterin-pyrophosphokinase
LNVVVEFEYDGDPARLLEQLIQIEETLAANRHIHGMFRESLMSDLLYCGEQRIKRRTIATAASRLHL